jgi:hypothetical protein
MRGPLSTLGTPDQPDQAQNVALIARQNGYIHMERDPNGAPIIPQILLPPPAFPPVLSA